MDFGDFVGGSIEGTVGVFGLVIGIVIFFWIVIKLIEMFSNGATRVSGLDPKSKEGENRATRLGFILFAVFILFALFIAPMI